MRVFKDGRPIGRIDFQVAVTRTGTQTGVVPVGDDAKFYRRCFCSYSSKDRTEALKRVQGLRAAGLDAFVDVLTLRPGDRWNDEIFSAIDESDLFVLIWSSNARESKWVRREVRYAVRRFKQRRSPDFHPIPIEGPPIPSVPRSLRCYHFNDVLLQIIHLAETTERELEDVVHPKAGNPRLIDWSS